MKMRPLYLGFLIAASLLLTIGCDLKGSDDEKDTDAEATTKTTTTTTTAVTFESAVQTGGTSGTAYTTGLILTFDDNITSLTLDHISLTGATKSVLTGSGRTRTLWISNISVDNDEMVSVAIANPPGFLIYGSPQTAVVYKPLFVGMPYQGGVIAYIFQPGDPGYMSGETHGLITSTADLSERIQWSDQSDIKSVGINGTSLGEGKANTATIVNSQGEGIYAAKLCYDYTNKDTGTGVYSDWYLPSKDELNKLYLNKVAIGGFANDLPYWSSSQYFYNTAWLQYFGDGSQFDLEKKEKFRVRAIRTF